MPTVKRFDRCKIVVRFDEHPPPHFHLVTVTGEEAAYRIDTLQLCAGEVDPRDATEALEWAAQNREALQAAWRRYTQEDKR